MVVVPVVIIIFIVFYTLYAKEKLQNSIKQSYEASSMKNGVLIESLSSIETLKSLGATGYSQWKWEEATSQIADKSISSKTISASITTVTSFLLQLNTVAIIIVGTYLIGEKMISMGFNCCCYYIFKSNSTYGTSCKSFINFSSYKSFIQSFR